MSTPGSFNFPTWAQSSFQAPLGVVNNNTDPGEADGGDGEHPPTKKTRRGHPPKTQEYPDQHGPAEANLEELKMDFNSCKASINNPVRDKRWTKAEDDRLQCAVNTLGENFALIAAQHFFESRSRLQCMHRWTHVLSTGRIKGPFLEAEDVKIRDCMQRGITGWNALAEHVSGRSAKQIRERWCNHLDPTLNHGPWGDAEDQHLMDAHEKYGNSWKHVAELMPGRSENNCKNRWNCKPLKEAKKAKLGLNLSNSRDSSAGLKSGIDESQGVLFSSHYLTSNDNSVDSALPVDFFAASPENQQFDQVKSDGSTVNIRANIPSFASAVPLAMSHVSFDDYHGSDKFDNSDSPGSIQQFLSAADSPDNSLGEITKHGDAPENLTAACIHELAVTSQALQAASTRINELENRLCAATAAAVEHSTVTFERAVPFNNNNEPAEDEVARLREENSQLKSSLVRLIAAARVAMAPPTRETAEQQVPSATAVTSSATNRASSNTGAYRGEVEV